MSPLIPANGSKMAMDIAVRAKSKYRRCLAIKPAGPCIEQHHRLASSDLAPLHQPLEAGKRGATLRTGVDRRTPRDPLGCGAQLFVGHRDGAPTCFPQRGQNEPTAERGWYA